MADKYCYRICHHSKVRQNAAKESKKYKAAVSVTEMDSSEPRKCHHRKTSGDFCVEKTSFDYNKPDFSQSIYTVERY